MKRKHICMLLPPAVLALGLAAFALRTELYAVAVDGKNLLIANHPLETALWAVVTAGVLLIVLSVQMLRGTAVYEDTFRASVPAGLGHILLSLAIGMMVLRNDFRGSDQIALIQRILGAVAVPALLCNAVCRMRGKKTFFLGYAVLCLFFLLHTISRYQDWSRNPQLQDYVFDLLAAVALILFSYHCAAFASGMGSRRMQLSTGLLAVLLCCAALGHTEIPSLYAGGAVWAITGLCRLTPPPKKEEVESHDPS